MLITTLTGIGVAVGVAVAVFTADVIMGVATGAGFIAVANQLVRLWTVTPVARSPIAEIRPAGHRFP